MKQIAAFITMLIVCIAGLFHGAGVGSVLKCWQSKDPESAQCSALTAHDVLNKNIITDGSDK